jgi:hypothetical protein
MATTNRVNITPVADTADLFCLYPGQQEPQSTYIALDIRDGALWASYSGEIGNAIPMNVYHGLVRRYYLPYPMLADVANELMADIMPLAQRVLDGASVEWDGSNRVGRLTLNAADAEAEIEAIILGYESGQEYNGVAWCDAADWFQFTEDEVRERLAAGATVEELAEEYDGDGSSPDSPILVGLENYLERLAADA